MADDVRFQSGVSSSSSAAENSSKVKVVIAWTFVLVPLAWGFTQTLMKAVVMFK